MEDESKEFIRDRKTEQREGEREGWKREEVLRA